jgi:hypothetical protein
MEHRPGRKTYRKAVWGNVFPGLCATAHYQSRSSRQAQTGFLCTKSGRTLPLKRRVVVLAYGCIERVSTSFGHRSRSLDECPRAYGYSTPDRDHVFTHPHLDAHEPARIADSAKEILATAAFAPALTGRHFLIKCDDSSELTVRRCYYPVVRFQAQEVPGRFPVRRHHIDQRTRSGLLILQRSTYQAIACWRCGKNPSPVPAYRALYSVPSWRPTSFSLTSLVSLFLLLRG